LVLTVIREILTLLAILHLEIAKNLFAAGIAEQLNSPLTPRYGLDRFWTVCRIFALVFEMEMCAAENAVTDASHT